MSSIKILKIGFRIVLVTLLFTILGFAVGGLIGIVSISAMRAAHLPVDMQNAIWFGAVPGGLLGSIAGFVLITISEKRTHSRA